MRTELIRRLVGGAALAALVAGGGLERRSEAQGLAPVSTCGIDMKVLVISADGSEADLAAITTTLDYLGTPYSLHVAKKAAGALTADRLSVGCHANYQAVIVTTGTVDNVWSGVLTAAELQALRNFEIEFKVREVVWYTFPNDFGLGFTGTTVNTIGKAPLTVSLTPAGATMFPYINRGPQSVKVGNRTVTVGNPARPLIVEQAIAYLATPDPSAATTPLIKDAAGNTLATVTNMGDGREILAMTFDSNANTMQTLLFGYGLVNWATRGLFVGERHAYLSPQIDDVFIADDKWTSGMSCATVGQDLPANAAGPTVRMTGNDLLDAVYWQSAKNAQPTTAALRLTMALNGWGTTGSYRSDSLTPAAKLLSSYFYWISHTYDHPVLDGIGYPAALAEFKMNNDVATKLKLKNYSTTSVVTPSISGLRDPQVMQAAADAGIKYVVTDTSQPGQDNPFPNVGLYNWIEPKVFMIPRRPVNLFYNVSTPADWRSEYNCLYKGFFGRDLTYQEILEFVSNQLLPYLLRGELDPWMFHQPNLVAYDGVHSLLSDLLDLTIAKYNGYFTLPIMSPSMDALGKLMEARTRLHYASVTATLQPGASITVTSSAAVTVPITGLPLPGAEIYGGQSIARVAVTPSSATIVDLSAGTVQTVLPPSAPTATAPLSGAIDVSQTATLTWSAPGAISYDVKFGTTNPPATVATGQAAPSYTPTLAVGTTYYWQVVAHNVAGSTAGPIWSFSTEAFEEIVIYASDIPSQNVHGTWRAVADSTAANGIALTTADVGWATTDVPLAAPADYVDITFKAVAGKPYTVWLRLKAQGNSKFNDAAWVQFSDALVAGLPGYAIDTASGLLVNLATDVGATSLINWGWANGAYWLTQPATVTFATTGVHTMRIQVREDGVQIDQIVLSSETYLTAAPGAVTNDVMIVAKP